MSIPPPPPVPGSPLPRPTPLALGVLVLATRLPFLGAGYGVEPDAWRVATAAREIAATGRYAASRLPGYPLHELGCGAIFRAFAAFGARAGPFATNGASAIACAIAVALFADVLRRSGVRAWRGAAIALGFVPVVFVASVSAKDYCWALAFAMAAWNCATRAGTRWALAAGVALGLAVGCRLTSGALAIPLGMILAARRPATGPSERPAGRLAAFLASTLVVSAITFAPVVATYGLAFFRFADPAPPSFALVAHRATVGVWGTVGCVALASIFAAIVALRSRRDPTRPSGPFASGPADVPRSTVAAWVAAVALYVVAFLRLPHQPGYLIPALPFGLGLLANFAPPRAFAWFVAAIVAAPFVGGLRLAETFGERVGSPLATEFRLAGRAIVFDPLAGPIVEDALVRRARARTVAEWIDRARAEPDAVVLAAWWLPQVAETLGPDAPEAARFFYSAADPGYRAAPRDAPRLAMPGAVAFDREVAPGGKD